MWGLVAGILLLAGSFWLVLDPILRPRPPVADPALDTGPDPDDDLSPRAVALRALAEIEFDRATGKLSQADYDALKARYTREALDALRQEQQAPPPVMAIASRTAPPTPPSPPVPPRAPQAPVPPHSCPVHGPRTEVGATYCSECGRRVGVREGDQFCGKCGSLLEPEARFCARCGDRVAA